VVAIRPLGPADVDSVLGAPGLFDEPPTREATERFLASPGHHLLMAFDDDGERALGFVSGVEMTHPDKGTELFLYELGVDERARGHGVGTALVEALRAVAVERGCYGMWVLTEDDNAAALATYRRAGGADPEPQVMVAWDLR
jgi:aminoglycoside 3-N-acetyltransferase I